MALPTFWQLLIPEFSVTTLIGIILILIGVFGSAFLKLIGAGLNIITRGKVETNVLVAGFILIGLFLIFGISFFNNLWGTLEGKLIIGGVVFLGVLAFILYGGKGQKTSKGL